MGHRFADRDPLASFWTKLSARSQSNLYFALAFADRKRREAFRSVYRFVRAADDVADAEDVPASEKLARLRVWRGELDAIYTGLYDGDDASTPPLAGRLSRTVREFNLTRAHFDDLLDGIERDVTEPRHPTAASLERYCEAVASSLAMLCLQILGATSEAEARYAWDVAIGLQLANVLRDVADDAKRGHIYLPQNALRAANVSDEDVMNGRWSPGFAEVCADICSHARDLIAGARELLPATSRRTLLVPEIWADVYLALLDELERIDFDVFTRKPYLRRRTKLRIAARRVARTAFVTRPRIFHLPPTMW